MGIVGGVVLFVVLILGMITFHEFGHFITARWSGMKITKFFVGFGPTLWSRRKGRLETVDVVDRDGSMSTVTRPEFEYGVKAIPAGGFVKIVGMSPAEDVPVEDEARSFRGRPAWKRAIVLVAGSATHILTTFLVLLFIYSVLGTQDPDKPTLKVDAIYAEVNGARSPALQAGLKPGDVIVAIDGKPAESFKQVKAAIKSHDNAPLQLTVRTAGGAERVMQVTPVTPKQEAKAGPIVGFRPVYDKVRLGPIAGMTQSAKVIGNLSVLVVKSTPRAFNPKNFLPGSKAPSDQRALSIYGAGRIAASLAAEGQTASFLWFFAQINLFVAIFNLFPIPPLDGGLLLLVIIEKIVRRPLNYRIVMPITYVAFALITFVGLSVLLQDILNPVANPFG